MRKSITFNTLILIMCLAHTPYTASMFRHGGSEDSSLQSHTSPYNPDTQSDSKSLHRTESYAGALDINANDPNEELLDIGAAPGSPMAQPNNQERVQQYLDGLVDLEDQPLPQNYAYPLYPSDDSYCPSDTEDDDTEDDDIAYECNQLLQQVNHAPTYDPNARFELSRQLYQCNEREYSDGQSRQLLFAIEDALQKYRKWEDEGLDVSIGWNDKRIKMPLREAIAAIDCCRLPDGMDDNINLKNGCMGISKELWQAKARNQIEKVKNRLAVSTNPNFTCHGENNRLHIALLHREHNIAQQLLDTDIDVETRDTLERTPLHIAAYLASHKVAEQLVATGANVGAKDCIKRTPLHHACQRGDISAVETPDHLVAQLLIANGAKIDAPDMQLRTPLHVAADNDHFPVIRLITDAGADVNSRDSQQKTPLHYAADRGYWQTVKLLLDLGANPNVADEYQRTPLHYAVSGFTGGLVTGHDKAVALLLRANADPNARDNRQHTPLFRVAPHGDAEIVKLLLDAGATATIIDTNGQNPLHFAACGFCFMLGCINNGSNRVAQLLLNAGIDPVTRDYEQRTPLDIALEDYLLITDTLLTYDSDMEVSAISPDDTYRRHPAHQGGTTLQLAAGLKLVHYPWQRKTNTYMVRRCVELGAKMENARPWQWSLR